MANQVEVSGNRVPITVRRPTLEIAKESGANIHVRDLPGGYKGIFVGTPGGGGRHRQPTKMELIDGVHAWADAFKQMHGTKQADFASRDYAKEPRKPKIVPWGNSVRLRRGWEFHEREKVAINGLLGTWRQTILAEEQRLLNIITRDHREPTAREMKNAADRVAATQATFQTALKDYMKGFTKTRGFVKLQPKTVRERGKGLGKSAWDFLKRFRFR